MENKENKELNLDQELDTLFKFAPPSQLKKSLHEVYAFYLQNLDISVITKHFNEIAMDFYLLHKFLEKAEECERLKNK